MSVKIRLLSLCVAVLALVTAPSAMAQDFPPLTGRVVDQADIIPPDVEAQLTQKLAALEQQSQRQVVVATIPDLGGYDIADYGYQLGREWGIGDAERNDGALLIVAPNDRKVRIEVGYGLEPVLTDGLSSIIVNQQILPRFRDGDMAGGIVAGTDAIIQQLTLPAEEAQRTAAEAETRQSSEGGFPIGLIIWGGFFLIFFVLPALSGKGRRRRGGIGSTVGQIILWEALSAATRSGGSFLRRRRQLRRRRRVGRLVGESHGTIS
jgi:uncharacterized protein